MSANSERLPPPNDPVEFESLCLDLWKDVWRDADAQRNGRSGQAQAGVDIFGQHEGRLVGVQCKQKDNVLWTKITARELDAEVAKARTFQPALSAFILATSGLADEKVQQRALDLSAAHKRDGLFTVSVWSWREIWTELYNRPQLLETIGPVYWPRLWAAFTRKRERNTRPRHDLLDSSKHVIAMRPIAPRSGGVRSAGKRIYRFAVLCSTMSLPISLVAVSICWAVFARSGKSPGAVISVLAFLGAILLAGSAAHLLVLSYKERKALRQSLAVGEGFEGHTSLSFLVSGSDVPPRKEETREDVPRKDATMRQQPSTRKCAFLQGIWPYRWSGMIFVVLLSPRIDETLIHAAIKGSRSARSIWSRFWGAIVLVCFALLVPLLALYGSVLLPLARATLVPMLSAVAAISICDLLIQTIVNQVLGECVRLEATAWQPFRLTPDVTSARLHFASEGISAKPIKGPPTPNDDAVVWQLDDVARLLDSDNPEAVKPSSLHNAGYKWELCTYGTLHNNSSRTVEVWDLFTRLYHASGQDRPLMCCLHRPRIELLQGNSIIESGKTYLLNPGDSLPVEVTFETSLFDTQVSTLVFGLFFRYHEFGTDSNSRQFSGCARSDAIFAFEHVSGSSRGLVDHAEVYVITAEEARIRSTERLRLQTIFERHHET